MSEPYELNINLSVLNHLGLNLYSNVPAVLSELVANAWDADASRVDVSIEKTGEDMKITIQDDGCGMNDSDFRDKFLTVGYQRRGQGSSTGDLTLVKKRPVMGRKGIGKLSAFSVAEKVQIISKKEDTESIAIELNIPDIRDAIDREESYHPSTISAPNDFAPEKGGTRLVLSKLKKRVNALLGPNLKKRVARRFSIFSEDFKVFINNEEITINDRDYFGKLEYSLVYGDYNQSNFEHTKKYIIPRDNNTVDKHGNYSIRGWIGLVKTSRALQDGDDNLNKISVLARGKVALEDILDSFREGGLYTKYIIGELEADFLDLTVEEDIATSSRQDFIQSDERFAMLREFVKNELKFLQRGRAALKEEEGEKSAREISVIDEWFKSLKGDDKIAAKKFFGKINQDVDDDKKKIFYKHGVLIFERFRYKEMLETLDSLDMENLEVAIKIFSNFDDIEASWYYEITRGRLDIIETLARHVEDDAFEKVLQKYIYTHLWLLDPSWDRATETATLEKYVIASFKNISENKNRSSDETEDQMAGRIDIKYKKTSGKHIIIELKRSTVKTDTAALIKQVDKYIVALEQEISLTGDSDTAIEAICIVGKELKDWNTPKRKGQSIESLKAKGIRVVTYQKLIKDARLSYQKYIDLYKDSKKGHLRNLLNQIEESLSHEY